MKLFAENLDGTLRRRPGAARGQARLLPLGRATTRATTRRCCRKRCSTACRCTRSARTPADRRRSAPRGAHRPGHRPRRPRRSRCSPSSSRRPPIDGTTFASIDGDVPDRERLSDRARARRSTSRSPLDSGLIAHGALLTGLTAEETNVAIPSFARAGVGQQAHEPSKDTRVLRVAVAVRDREPARGRAEARAAARAARLERRRRRLRCGAGSRASNVLVVLRTRATSRTSTAPRILGTGRRVDRVRHDVQRRGDDDESGVARVVVLYRSGNQYLPLDLVARRGHRTRGSVRVAGVTDPRFIVQAIDVARQRRHQLEQGRAVHGERARLPTSASRSTARVGDNGWFTGTPPAALVGDVDPDAVAGLGRRRPGGAVLAVRRASRPPTACTT